MASSSYVKNHPLLVGQEEKEEYSISGDPFFAQPILIDEEPKIHPAIEDLYISIQKSIQQTYWPFVKAVFEESAPNILISLLTRILFHKANAWQHLNNTPLAFTMGNIVHSPSGCVWCHTYMLYAYFCFVTICRRCTFVLLQCGRPIHVMMMVYL